MCNAKCSTNSPLKTTTEHMQPTAGRGWNHGPVVRGRVLFRTTPLPGESGRGFLLRAADDLEYPTPTFITGLAKITPNGLDSLESVQRVAYVLRLEPGLLWSHFYGPIPADGGRMLRSFLGQAIRPTFLNYRIPRICAACLSEQSVWWAIWDINLVTVCPRHGCELINACPSCNRSLSWRRPRVHQCRCGFDLRNAGLTTASESALALTALLHRAVKLPYGPDDILSRARYCDGLINLPFPQLLRVVRFLGYMFHPLGQGLRQIHREGANVSHTRKAVEAAHEILAKWPEPFSERLRVLKEQYKVDDPYGRKLMEGYGNFYRHLFKELAEPEFRFLHESFEDFVVEDWDGLVRGQHRFFAKARAGHRWITATRAADLVTGIDKKALKRLVNDGTLNGFNTSEGPNGRRETWIERRSVEAWARDAENWMSRSAAGRILGLSHATLMALGHAGILRFKHGAVPRLMASWNFHKEDIDQMLGAFEALDVPAVSYRRGKGDVIALRHALEDFLGRDRGFPAVVRAVMEGKLMPVGRTNQFKGILDFVFPKTEIRLFRPADTETPPGGFVNFTEAQQLLGVPQMVVTALVRHGVLHGSMPNKFGEERLIPVHTIASFQERFVFASALGAAIGSTARWINNYLSSIGISGTVLHFGKKGVSVIYEKAVLVGVTIPLPKHRRRSTIC